MGVVVGVTLAVVSTSAVLADDTGPAARSTAETSQAKHAAKRAVDLVADKTGKTKVEAARVVADHARDIARQVADRKDQAASAASGSQAGNSRLSQNSDGAKQAAPSQGSGTGQRKLDKVETALDLAPTHPQIKRELLDRLAAELENPATRPEAGHFFLTHPELHDQIMSLLPPNIAAHCPISGGGGGGGTGGGTSGGGTSGGGTTGGGTTGGTTGGSTASSGGIVHSRNQNEESRSHESSESSAGSASAAGGAGASSAGTSGAAAAGAAPSASSGVAGVSTSVASAPASTAPATSVAAAPAAQQPTAAVMPAVQQPTTRAAAGVQTSAAAPAQAVAGARLQAVPAVATLPSTGGPGPEWLAGLSMLGGIGVGLRRLAALLR